MAQKWPQIVQKYKTVQYGTIQMCFN